MATTEHQVKAFFCKYLCEFHSSVLHFHSCAHIRSTLLQEAPFTKAFIEAKEAEKRRQRSPPIKGEVKEREWSAASCVSVQVREEEKRCHESVELCHLANIMQMCKMNIHITSITHSQQCFNTSTTVTCVLSFTFMHIHNFLIHQVCERVFVGSVLPDQTGWSHTMQTGASCAQVETNP